ncbi:hypothetical protein AB1Y20_007830 [Prymnesium parvum]|uniref:Acetyl-CoA C-acetyltransferase n=1 Tax=Prymnesium parvum TaxID=97485 RepID=A0AB34IS07_PRYPA
MPPVILAAARTAIGSFGGSLASLPAPALGAVAIRAVLERGGLAAADETIARVDEVLMGNVLTAGLGQNPARQAAVRAGLPHHVPSLTVDHVCGSGLQAVILAARAVRSGDASLVVAGGQESMSRAPHVLPASREGQRMGGWELKDSMVSDGLWCAFNDYHMGITAENIAQQYSLSREAQDEYAAASQQRAEAAIAAGWFDREIVAVPVPQKKGEPLLFARDEYPKPGVTADKLAKLRPAFQKEGSVTAGNASGLNDGAAALLVASDEYAASTGTPVLARIVAAASAGVDPRVMGMGPVPAVRKCLAKAGWRVEDLDLVEANEAFAAQSLAVCQQLRLDAARVNVCGGAIALGHPIGASGARVLVTLVHQMHRLGAKKGLATLCIGGGQGVAVAVEVP